MSLAEKKKKLLAEKELKIHLGKYLEKIFQKSDFLKKIS